MEEDFNTLHGLLPMSNRKTSIRLDDEVLELVWQNGNVITNNQNSRRTVPSFNEPDRYNAPYSDIPLKCGGQLETCNDSIREDETVPWFQYLLDDSLGKDMCFDSSFRIPFNEVPHKSRNEINGSNEFVEFGCPKETNPILGNMMPLLPVQQINGAVDSRFINSSRFSSSARGDAGSTDDCLGVKGVETASNNDVGHCSSTATKASSNFCSNQVKSQPVLHNTLLRNVLLDKVTKQVDDSTREVHSSRLTSTCDITTTTTSSVASGSSIRRMVQQQSTSDRESYKRKVRYVEESDYHSEEEADYLSRDERKPPRRSASAHRSRSSEVHNLSERRRRDRINEKMKALQELIPHCNKSDKASMLDEAIEYLKSLQLQVQIMWMRNGMAPMMLPNVQHYLSSLTMGMSHGSVSALPGSLTMPKSIIDPSMSSSNVTNQAAALAHSALLQNENVPDAYAHYLRFNHIQPPLEVSNIFTPYSSQFQRVPTVGSNQATEGIGPSENTRHGY